MADLYKSKVEELAAALQRVDKRLEASETLRGLIEAIRLDSGEQPAPDRAARECWPMLAAAQQTKRSPETGGLFVPIQLVAGGRNPLNLEFAWTAA